MKKKKSFAEIKMRNQLTTIIKKAMGCENREPDHMEIVQFLQRNQHNERLWLCMAGVLEGKQRFQCLERALHINPNNKATFNCMKRVNHKRAYKVARKMNLFDYSLKPQQAEAVNPQEISLSV